MDASFLQHALHEGRIRSYQTLQYILAIDGRTSPGLRDEKGRTQDAKAEGVVRSSTAEHGKVLIRATADPSEDYA